jgi:hypothetical protein
MEKMNYTGHDIIFATGAPGSKWSRILSLIGLHPSLNSSDKDKFPRYNLDVQFDSGKIIPVGNHTGAYFGPDNQIGENFEDLTKMSKDEFIAEIKKPFDNWENGIKIVKSHWFSYNKNLNWLRSNFPDAKIVMVYNGNEVAFKWWHFVGGWDISFPTYTWYETDERMYNKIIEENKCIMKFSKENLVPIRFYSDFKEILTSLELSDDLNFLKTLTEEDKDLVRKLSFTEQDLMEQFNGSVKGAAIGILSNNSKKCNTLDEFKHHVAESNIVIRQRHINLKIDLLLSKRHGDAWLDQINNIIHSASDSD